MTSDHVAILMATFNGAKYLREQLQSIAQQTHRNWSLWISDDGSSDDTRAVIEDFAAKDGAGRTHVQEGPQTGPVGNFLSLIKPTKGAAPFYAFADQDDVWLPDKLQRGAAILAPKSASPCLYGTRTIVADADLNRKGLSPLFRRPPQFANAIVQSIAGGNTMMLTRAAHNLLGRAGVDLELVTHDWWAYQLIAGAGGQVIYDPEPSLLYRQHGANLIGSNSGPRAQLLRWRAVMNGRFSAWNGCNLAALDTCRDLLTIQNRDLMQTFADLRRMRGKRALQSLRRSGIYRQTRAGNRSLEVAAYLGKL